MHRELYSMYFNNDVVVVELSLNGTHKRDLEIPEGVISPTNKEMHARCCVVFSPEGREGSVFSLLRCGLDPSRATRDIQKRERCHQEIAALRFEAVTCSWSRYLKFGEPEELQICT
jgi:hypothetical protein